MRLLREKGLTLFFLALFLATVVAQAGVGVAGYNHDQLTHHSEPISVWSYLVNSRFAANLMEKRSMSASSSALSPGRRTDPSARREQRARISSARETAVRAT